MKVLLVHPFDSVEAGPWTETAWNLIVDLGWSGRHCYSQLEKRFGCRVLSIYDLLTHREHRSRLRGLLAMGLDQVVDSESVDWWDMFSALHYQQIEQFMLLEILAEQISRCTDIFTTREHAATRVLARLLRRQIKIVGPARKAGIGSQGSRYWKRMLALRPSQMAEIAFDKWDTGYRLRRHISRRPSPSGIPVALLPSAYGNVTRVQLAYAQMLPERQFLLVVTRRSGRLGAPIPANISVRSLASYAPARCSSTERERVRLLEKWRELQNDRFAQDPILDLALKTSTFAGFPEFLASGLRVRDAWREVLAKEQVTAVLSADEHNPFTRLPIVLAKTRKKPTIFCDHGALNMSFGIRRTCSDVYLASGDMARDYMTAWCSLPADKIIVGGAPNAGPSRPTDDTPRDRIVFFSEQYELSSARTQTFYSELLPELCSLARQTNRKVIVKLHPFESTRVREAMVDKAVSAEDRALIEIREGSMTPDLFERAWFTVTVESSVAVESTMNRVPCFLCGWFDASWYDYARQFAKYSAGYWLGSPESIRRVPQLLTGITITDNTRRALHTSMSPEQLDSILFGS